jgi:hypothetical protein
MGRGNQNECPDSLHSFAADLLPGLALGRVPALAEERGGRRSQQMPYLATGIVF